MEVNTEWPWWFQVFCLFGCCLSVRWTSVWECFSVLEEHSKTDLQRRKPKIAETLLAGRVTAYPYPRVMITPSINARWAEPPGWKGGTVVHRRVNAVTHNSRLNGSKFIEVSKLQDRKMEVTNLLLGYWSLIIFVRWRNVLLHVRIFRVRCFEHLLRSLLNFWGPFDVSLSRNPARGMASKMVVFPWELRQVVSAPKENDFEPKFGRFDSRKIAPIFHSLTPKSRGICAV